MLNNILKNIIEGNLKDAKRLIHERLNSILQKKMVSMRKVIGAEFMQKEELSEGNVVRQGRIKLIRRRIRKGKVQRNIRKSAVKGYTLRRGKLRRITAIQKIRMRRVQKRAARKRKAHMRSTVRKRLRSIRRRKSMGIK